MAIRMTGMISGMDTESLIKGMMDAQKLKNKRTTDKKDLLTFKQDKWKELNAKLYKLYTDDLSKLRLQGNYQTKKVTSSNESLVSVTGGTSATAGEHKVEVKALASAQYLTGGKIEEDGSGSAITPKSSTTLNKLGVDIGTKIYIKDESNPLVVDENTTIADLVKAAKDAGLNASFDEKQGRIFISSKNSGEKNKFTITSSINQLSKLGLPELKSDVLDETGTSIEGLVRASDSKIIYNGAELTGKSNIISVNGLTITAKGLTAENEKLSLNVTNDTQATYDMIKKFVTNYNTILKEMNSLFYADSSKGYNPLSDDEREQMTDSQVEKWETKIKDSILRRDTGLGSLITSMSSALSSTAKVGNTSYHLSSFGIQTSSDYSEKGLLHIAGDKDDAAYADREDKLMKALEEDPDTVITAFTTISKNLYDTMASKMKGIPNVRSSFTFYNDKLMDKTQTEYKKNISVLEKKLTIMENKYYKQFAAMETALAKMQSQSSAVAGMLGTSQQ